MSAASVGPNATFVNPNAVQTDCGIRIPSGFNGGNVGIDVEIPNTASIFNFTSFKIGLEYRDQESQADIVTGGNLRVYHIGPNRLGIRINVIDGITGLSTAYTQTLGNFLAGSSNYEIIYDEVTGNVIYTANGTETIFNIAPPSSPLDTSLATGITLGRFMDNSSRAFPSLCFFSVADNSLLCDTAFVNITVRASIITNKRITYRVKPN